MGEGEGKREKGVQSQTVVAGDGGACSLPEVGGGGEAFFVVPEEHSLQEMEKYDAPAREGLHVTGKYRERSMQHTRSSHAA